MKIHEIRVFCTDDSIEHTIAIYDVEFFEENNYYTINKGVVKVIMPLNLIGEPNTGLLYSKYPEISIYTITQDESLISQFVNEMQSYILEVLEERLKMTKKLLKSVKVGVRYK